MNKTMKLSGNFIEDVKADLSATRLFPPGGSADHPERKELAFLGKDLSHSKVLPSSANQGLFGGLLIRVSKIRVAVRAIARICNIAREKSFKGGKKAPSPDDENAAWFILVRDQQGVMGREKLAQGKYLPFEENGILFTRQRWDITTHTDLFKVGMNETSLPGKILLQKPLVFKNSLAIHSQ